MSFLCIRAICERNACMTLDGHTTANAPAQEGWHAAGDLSALPSFSAEDRNLRPTQKNSQPINRTILKIVILSQKQTRVELVTRRSSNNRLENVNRSSQTEMWQVQRKKHEKTMCRLVHPMLHTSAGISSSSISCRSCVGSLLGHRYLNN